MNRLTIQCALWWLAVAVAFCCRESAVSDGPQPDSPSESVRLTLSMKIARDVWIMTDWSQPPQVAVWLEDPSGSTVRTLFVTHRTGAGDWKGKAGCDVSLPYWVGRYNVETATSGPPTFQRPVADAITQPTPKESLVVTTLVPPGSEWRYFVEVNVSGDFNKAFPEQFDNRRPDEAGNGQPSLVYRGHIQAVPGQQNTPKLIARTDQFRAASNSATTYPASPRRKKCCRKSRCPARSATRLRRMRRRMNHRCGGAKVSLAQAPRDNNKSWAIVVFAQRLE